MAETHQTPTLHAVAPFIVRSLSENERGIVVLALDGLPYAPAEDAFRSAAVGAARSTFPSTSVTAWLTAVTGTDVARHGAAGMAMRVPGTQRVASLVGGDADGWDDSAPAPDDLVRSQPTIFDSARAIGADALFWAPDLEGLSGPWITALTRGVDWLASGYAADLPASPVAAMRRTLAAVDGLLASAKRPTLLWAYVNLDDHLHTYGPDAAVEESLRLLDAAAQRWADAGWRIVAHSDHGQTRVDPRPDLQDAWARLATPKFCRAPAGGAGRVRWLYPYAEQADQVAAELADALGDQADVVGFDDLAARGLLADAAGLRERVGEVVAIATGAGFPVYRASDAYDHGATTLDETTVPFAVWPPGPTLPHPPEDL
jgi:hypothetical protein